MPHEFFRVPCGQCIGCRKARAREWAFRCSLELSQHEAACWTTLTYEDKYLPPTLSKAHLSGYLKRLRARLPDARVRFFGCGEYGEKRGRPHYHVILYGLDRTETAISASWTAGHVYTEPLTPRSIAYVAGYTNKKVERDVYAKRERVDPDTGEVYTYQPNFLLMSRRPGIGGDARKFWQSWKEKAVYNGKPIPVPRFLHESWKQNTSEEQHLKLKEDKKAKINPENHTWERLKAGEAIACSFQKLQAQQRKL